MNLHPCVQARIETTAQLPVIQVVGEFFMRALNQEGRKGVEICQGDAHMLIVFQRARTDRGSLEFFGLNRAFANFNHE